MKRVLLAILYGFIIFNTSAADKDINKYEYSMCVRQNGIWGKWYRTYRKAIVEYYPSETRIFFVTSAYGTSAYWACIRFNGFGIKNTDARREKRQHRKQKKWYEYNGVMTIFTDTEYFLECLSKDEAWRLADSKKPELKNNSFPVTIRIAPFRNEYPDVFNIWIDNNRAIAVDFDVPKNAVLRFLFGGYINDTY